MAITRQPEIMVRGADESGAADELIESATVIAVGPGLGTGPGGQQLLERVLASGKPLVVDADALNLLAAHADVGAHDWVLTPHPGEAARLLQVGNAEIQSDRFATLETLSARYGGTVLLKGLGTLIQGDSAGQRCRALIVDGNPGMASGGMGDVLTGVIAALRAQGLNGMMLPVSAPWHMPGRQTGVPGRPVSAACSPPICWVRCEKQLNEGSLYAH